MPSTSRNAELGATEDWVIVNPTMDPHPIHIHPYSVPTGSATNIGCGGSITDEWLRINGLPPFNHPTQKRSITLILSKHNHKQPQPEEQAGKTRL